MEDVSKALSDINFEQQKLEIKKNLYIDKALRSEDPDQIVKAQNIIANLQQREERTRKSILVDPQSFSASFGYKDRPMTLSYRMLHNMAKQPIIAAIIRTRINQVASYCTPQKDKYSIGYEIRKKSSGIGGASEEDNPTEAEQKEIQDIYNFLTNCGDRYRYDGDRDFETWVRKVMRDSLTYDQMCFEVAYNRGGKPYAFWSTDAATMRFAENYNKEALDSIMETGNPHIRQIKDNMRNTAVSGYGNFLDASEEIKGYKPMYVQIYQGQPIAEFYPWEMCFGIRNPHTDIYANGYGISELEELVMTITSMLWGEEYNRKFFKNGASPKGMLKVTGQINADKLTEFKQQWNATMNGVWNAWKTPILEADKVEWVDLQKNNRDMEYHAWIEFLIKTACAVFTMDPSEVNFPLQGGAKQDSLFGGGTKDRTDQSKNKGLYPLLRFLSNKINRFIIDPLTDGKYEFAFAGLDNLGRGEELDLLVKKVSNLNTVDEIRAMQGDKPLGKEGGGELILNPVWLQWYMNKQQMEAMGNAQGGAENPMVDQYSYDQEGEQGGGQGSEEYFNEEGSSQEGSEQGSGAEENPIQKAYEEFFNKVNNKS